MSSLDFENDDERSASAGEYVLGSLAPEDRAAVEQRLPDDPALQRDVAWWQDRLLGLTARVAPAEVAPAVWSRIEARLDAWTTAATPSPSPRPAPASARRQPSVAAPSFWDRLAVWRFIGGIATAAAIVLAVLLVALPPAETPQYLAVLQDPRTQAAAWIVEAAPGRPLRLVPIGTGTAPPPGRALQFWTKQDSAPGPTSLGLVQAGQALEVPAAALPGLEATQLFEITLEPEGGSTIGRPTGPILYIGRAIRL